MVPEDYRHELQHHDLWQVKDQLLHKNRVSLMSIGEECPTCVICFLHHSLMLSKCSVHYLYLFFWNCWWKYFSYSSNKQSKFWKNNLCPFLNFRGFVTPISGDKSKSDGILYLQRAKTRILQNLIGFLDFFFIVGCTNQKSECQHTGHHMTSWFIRAANHQSQFGWGAAFSCQNFCYPRRRGMVRTQYERIHLIENNE